MSKLSSKAAPLANFSALNTKLNCNICTYCLNKLENVSIKCGECENFFLCLKCFSMSAEIGEHKKDHNYYLKSSASFPIFDSEACWSFKEELLLLQFIEQYGFGNWEEITKHLPSRTSEDCMQHYYSYYIYGNLGKYILGVKIGQNGCLIDQSCDNLSSLSLNGMKKVNQSESSHRSLSKSSLNSIQLSNSIPPTSSSSSDQTSDLATTVLLPPIEMSLEEQRALGYMPLRDDFEREVKNDAESLISNLVVSNNQLAFLEDTRYSSEAAATLSALAAAPDTLGELNEDQMDFELKLNLIEMYRDCLMERARYKKIAREYGLINNASALINNYNKYISGITATLNLNEVCKDGRKRKYSTINDKEMIELNEKLRKFAQFMSVSDYETLLENLRKQRQLYARIDKLHHYRSELGITSLSQIDAYLKAKQERKLTKPKRFSYLLGLSKRVTRGGSRTQSPNKSCDEYASPSKRPNIRRHFSLYRNTPNCHGKSNGKKKETRGRKPKNGLHNDLDDDIYDDEDDHDDEEGGSDQESEFQSDEGEDEGEEFESIENSEGLVEEDSDEELEGSNEEGEEEDGDDEEDDDKTTTTSSNGSYMYTVNEDYTDVAGIRL